MPRDRDPIDDARLLPRFRARKLELRPSEVTVEAETTSSASSASHVSKAPGDPWALRGFPIVSRDGLGGAIPGTQPEQHLVEHDPFDDPFEHWR